MGKANADSIKNANKRLFIKSTIIILIGIGILSGLTIYIVSKSPSLKDRMQAEVPVEREAKVQLSVQLQQAPKKIIPVENLLKAGDVLVFSISSNVPRHIALAVSMNGNQPQLVFDDTRIPPGENRILEKLGEKYQYKIASGVSQLRFCILQAANRKELLFKQRDIDHIWRDSPESYCKEFKVF